VPAVDDNHASRRHGGTLELGRASRDALRSTTTC